MSVCSVQKTFKSPSKDGNDIYNKSLIIMGRIREKMPLVRALGVTCANLQKGGYLPLFPNQKRREQLLETIDRINDKLGDDTIYPAVISLAKN